MGPASTQRGPDMQHRPPGLFCRGDLLMGTDIYWVLERRHPDGGWHATASKTRITHCKAQSAPDRHCRIAPDASAHARLDFAEADGIYSLGHFSPAHLRSHLLDSGSAVLALTPP